MTAEKTLGAHGAPGPEHPGCEHEAVHTGQGMGSVEEGEVLRERRGALRGVRSDEGAHSVLRKERLQGNATLHRSANKILRVRGVPGPECLPDANTKPWTQGNGCSLSRKASFFETSEEIYKD